MDTRETDRRIRDIVQSSPEMYHLEAEEARERIWNRVRSGTEVRREGGLIHILAAACVLFFISSAGMSFALLRVKKTEHRLLESNSLLQQETEQLRERAVEIQESFRLTSAPHTDTLFMEREKLVYVPVKEVIQLRDTVFLERKVYLEKEPVPLTLAERRPGYGNMENIEGSSPFPSFETRFLITKIEPAKEERNKRLRIRFGTTAEGSGSEGWPLSAKF